MSEPALRQVEIPRPRVDARTASWLIEQRARIKELEAQTVKLRGELDVSSLVERSAQRICDRLEEELEKSRQREATLARALGYAEAQRDQLAQQLAEPASSPPRRRLLGRRRG